MLHTILEIIGGFFLLILGLWLASLAYIGYQVMSYMGSAAKFVSDVKAKVERDKAINN